MTAEIPEIDAGMIESEWVSKMIGQPVVKAFNHIFAASLAERGLPSGSPGRISLSIFGDDQADKQLVLGLINDIGFDGVDAGSLADSWRQQPGTPAYTHRCGRGKTKSRVSQRPTRQNI